MRYAYGIVNVVFFNRRASGDETWFVSKPARDIALTALRDRAIERGLSLSTAKAGIYPVRRHIASESGAAWFAELKASHIPGIRLEVDE